MGGKDPLGGLADMKFFLRRIPPWRRTRCWDSIVRSSSRGGIGHAQIGAEHVDDGLALLGVVLGEALKGVQSTESDWSPVVAKLLAGLGEELGDAPLLGVELLKALAAVGQQQVGRPAGPKSDCCAGLDGVGLQLRPVNAGRYLLGLREQQEYYHQAGPYGHQHRRPED
jgi:hypothetical protein